MHTPPRLSGLDLLMPAFRERLERVVSRARDGGLSVHVFETLRTGERQEALFAQGRTLPGPVITRARADLSWHQYGLAADLAFDANPKTPKVEWSWNGNWKRLGELIVSEGLTWYGSPGSPFREAPHCQLTGGLPLSVARSLKSKGGLPMVWQAVMERLKGGPL